VRHGVYNRWHICVADSPQVKQHFAVPIDDQEAELAVEAAVRQLNGSTTISDLVDAVGLAGRAYGAILNSIYRGVLHQVSAGLIDYGTIVRSGAMS
jgi:hypothetical protein